MSINNKTILESIQNLSINNSKGNNKLKTIKSFNLNFGPQHPAAHGVLRMVLQLNGEIIEKVDTHIGLLHRGTEKLIESKKYLLGLPYFDRLDYCSMLIQEHTFCLGLESLNSLENNNVYNLNLRTILDELTRILNHLLAVSCHALDIGSMSSIFWAFEEREFIMELYERLSGARMHAAFYRPFNFSKGFLNIELLYSITSFSSKCLITLNEIHNVLTYNKSWKQRLINIGVLNLKDVTDYALTGVLARSAGVNMDLRLQKTATYGSYYYLTFQTFLGWNGDCFDRYLIRLTEMVESLTIINQIIGNSFWKKSNLLYKEPLLNLSSKTIRDLYNTNLSELSNKNIISNKIIRFLLNDTTKIKSYQFLKMSNILSHFKEWTSGSTKLKKNITFKSVESPKGRFAVILVGDGMSSIPYRCKIRSPSLFNLQFLGKLAKGYYLTDLITLIGTIDIVFGEIDR